MDYLGLVEGRFSAADVERSAQHVLNILIEKRLVLEKPKLVILGGQPGAGKTAALNALDIAIPFVNADEYRVLHPNHSQLVKDPATFPEYTQPFVNGVANSVVEHCFRDHLSFAVEGTMRNPAVPIATMRQCRASGGDYEIELHVVTVPARVSWQSCVERYERMVALDGQGRSVNKEIHDNAVKILAENVATIIETGLADRVYIRDRNEPHFVAKSVSDAAKAAATVRTIQSS